MTKAKLVSAAVALSIILGNNAARAAENTATKSSVDSATLTQAAPAVNSNAPADALLANLVSKYAVGDMAELGDILVGDMPPPSGKSIASPVQKRTEKLAVAAPDAAPSLEKHMGMGEAPVAAGGPDMHEGMAMGGGGHIIGHFRCPLNLLDGPNALSDDQYQKLYDIKGQFITTVVPKGLNMYGLIRKMQDLLTAPSLDTPAVRDLEKQISSGTSDISMTVMDSLVSVSQVLTPDQRKELHKRLIQAEVGGGWHHHDAPHPEKKE